VGNQSGVTAAADFKEALRNAGPGAKGELTGDHYVLTTRAGGQVRRLWKRIDEQREIVVEITYDTANEAYFAPVAHAVFRSVDVPGPM
jgi:hypothetical protein